MKIATFASGIQDKPGFRAFQASARGLDVDVISPAVPVTNPIRERWQWIATYLIGLKSNDPVLLIDSRDVVFLRSPCEYLLNEIEGADIVFFSEGQAGHEHPWCRAQYDKLAAITNLPFTSKQEINGGCIAGRAGALMDMSRALCRILADVGASSISDQPVINFWADVICKHSSTVISNVDFYCHGELVKLGRWPRDPMESTVFHQWDRTKFKQAILARFT